ncbi:hypothetical protein C8Q74DRAFT_1282257 [Fomes fomentarius]|nr:hypothetical protein C8Q74DRAFT_1282257 [Fomes fomentarius]
MVRTRHLMLVICVMASANVSSRVARFALCASGRFIVMSSLFSNRNLYSIALICSISSSNVVFSVMLCQSVEDERNQSR